jgi:DNA-binding CsgD family transcriptional regulator
MRAIHPRLWGVTITVRMSSALSNPDRRRVVVSFTRGTRRNIDVMNRVEEEHGSVHVSGIELRVLELMRLSKTTREIAATLCIPERTAELHIRHSLRRLRARSREELLLLLRGYH